MKIVQSPVSGCSGVDTPPTSHRSHVATNGSSPIAACSAAWTAPGQSARGDRRPVDHRLRDRPPHGLRLEVLRRERERDLVDHVVRGDELHHVAHDLVRDAHGAEERVDVAGPALLVDVDHLDVGDVARLRVVVGIGLVHDRHARHQVQLVDQVLLALVQVHGARDAASSTRDARRRCRAALPSRRSRSSRCVRLPRGCRPSGAGTPAHGRSRCPCAAPALRARSCARPRARRRPRRRRTPRSSSRSGSSRAAHRRCGSRTYGFVGSITAASGGLSNRSSGWCTRYWSSGSSCATSIASESASRRPARPGLLPHRRARARVAGEHGGVERADVDAQLERVRRGDREQLAVRQLPLDRPTILGQVAGPIRLDPRALLRVAHVATRELRQQLRGSPRPGEADRADVVLDQPRHQPRRLGERAPPGARCPRR